MQTGETYTHHIKGEDTVVDVLVLEPALGEGMWFVQVISPGLFYGMRSALHESQLEPVDGTEGR